MQKQVGQDRANDPALWRPLFSWHKRTVLQHLGCFQPTLDIQQHPPTLRVLAHRTQEEPPIDAVEETLDVKVDDPVVAPASLTRCPDGIDCRTPRPISIRVRMEHWFQQRLQISTNNLLRNAIRNRRNAQRSRSAIRLRYVHPAYRRRQITAR